MILDFAILFALICVAAAIAMIGIPSKKRFSFPFGFVVISILAFICAIIITEHLR